MHVQSVHSFVIARPILKTDRFCRISIKLSGCEESSIHRKSDGSFSKCEIENWNNGQKFRPPSENLCRSKRRNTRGSLPPQHNPVVISFHVTSYRLSNLPCETITRIEIRQRKHVCNQFTFLPLFLSNPFKKSDDFGSSRESQFSQYH